MITAIDTNVILDILVGDPEFGDRSIKLIKDYGFKGSLVISQVVYSEVLVFFLRKHERKSAINKFNEFLDDLGIQIYNFNIEDFNLAAEAWNKFSSTDKITCPKCGSFNKFDCRKCNSQLLWRNHMITDFLIGAHAQNHADIIITRDREYYKKYFNVKVIYSV